MSRLTLLQGRLLRLLLLWRLLLGWNRLIALGRRLMLPITRHTRRRTLRHGIVRIRRRRILGRRVARLAIKLRLSRRGTIRLNVLLRWILLGVRVLLLLVIRRLLWVILSGIRRLLGPAVLSIIQVGIPAVRLTAWRATHLRVVILERS